MNTASGKPGERRECLEHDSARVDGWLDSHCLRCGADGYWREGVRFAEVDIHPSGKVLIRPADGEQPSGKPITARHVGPVSDGLTAEQACGLIDFVTRANRDRSGPPPTREQLRDEAETLAVLRRLAEGTDRKELG